MGGAAAHPAACCAQVQRKLNRLVVVDDEGKLKGVLSRGDIMRATMAHFRWQMDLEEAAELRSEPIGTA